MNLFTGEAADAYFGGEVPPTVRGLLQQAVSAPRSEVGALLWTAQALAPSCLPVYYALYKHHAGLRQLDLAERAAQRGLTEAAAQAGLPADWRQARPGLLPAGLSFHSPGPARFWLFTLKALAFIALRSRRLADARDLLAHIAALDNRSGMGDEVIAEMLRSAEGEGG